MKFFITGCGRSGTYLITSLFETFKNMEVVMDEIDILDFLSIKQKKKHIISKRKALFYNNQNKVKKAKDNNVKLINMVRDGRDVVTSKMIVKGKHIKKRDGYPYWIKPKRWIKEIISSLKFYDYIDLEIKYEDLVIKPNYIQDKIVNMFGVEKIKLFTEHTKIFDSSVGRGKELHKKLEIPDKFYDLLKQKGYL